MMMVDDDGGDGDDDDRGDGDDEVVVVETVMMHYQQATPLFCSRPEKPQGKGGGTRFEPLHAMNFFYTGRFNDGVMSTSLWENLFSLFEFFFKT